MLNPTGLARWLARIAAAIADHWVRSAIGGLPCGSGPLAGLEAPFRALFAVRSVALIPTAPKDAGRATGTLAAFLFGFFKPAEFRCLAHLITSLVE